MRAKTSAPCRGRTARERDRCQAAGGRPADAEVAGLHDSPMDLTDAGKFKSNRVFISRLLIWQNMSNGRFSAFSLGSVQHEVSPRNSRAAAFSTHTSAEANPQRSPPDIPEDRFLLINAIFASVMKII